MDAAAVTTPPPLTRWQSAWRYLAAVVVGLAFWSSALVTEYDGELATILAADLLLGAVGVGLLHWRRRYPLPTALAIIAVGAVSTAASGAVIVVTVSLATRRRWREILPAGAVSVLATIVYFEIHPDSWHSRLAAVLFAIVFVCAATATGMYIGARRDLLSTLQERAERAEREQGMRVEQAQVTERTRIAREMHDVLAHRLSLVAMHAGALSYTRGMSESEVAEAADVIRSNTHHALADLRQILGVLRTAETDAPPERPQPTLVDLTSLVQEAKGAGTTVRLDNQIVDPAGAPDAIGRSAYRMIQESLTNARKHAPDTTVDVVLSGHPGGQLVLEVRNPIRVGAGVSGTPGAGLGLIGLTERAELIGGRLEHETSDGDFVVRAWLPWPA